MKPENKRMKDFLKDNGITAKATWISTGSLKGNWRLYNPEQKWTRELEKQLTQLGFVGFDNKPLTWVSGNGGMFSVFVKGYENLAPR